MERSRPQTSTAHDADLEVRRLRIQYIALLARVVLGRYLIIVVTNSFADSESVHALDLLRRSSRHKRCHASTVIPSTLSMAAKHAYVGATRGSETRHDMVCLVDKKKATFGAREAAKERTKPLPERARSDPPPS